MEKVEQIMTDLRQNDKDPSESDLQKLTREEREALFEKLLELAEERKMALDKFLKNK